MRIITDRGMRKIVENAVATGNWVLEEGGKHMKLHHLKSGVKLPFSITTSDIFRAHKNVLRDIDHVERGIHKFCTQHTKK